MNNELMKSYQSRPFLARRDIIWVVHPWLKRLLHVKMQTNSQYKTVLNDGKKF